MPPASPLEFSSLLRTYRYPLRITPLLRTQTSISRTIHRRSFNSSSSNSNSSSTHNHSPPLLQQKACPTCHPNSYLPIPPTSWSFET
ncbi:hypothetical protein HYQ46_003770 [Verticillium longisporum]|nr:hypothetical protein HYQ46_003770 [Verticillium longisporum]